MLRRLSEFTLFGSIFISACAVALCIETSLLLHVPLNSISFYCFVFGATLVQYNLHYLLKKKAVSDSLRLAWSLKNKTVHKILIAIGVTLILFSFFSFRVHHFLVLIVLGAISFFYSVPALPFGAKKRIKDFGLLKIVTLALMWTLVTVWFPISQENFSNISFQLVFLRRFIFMFVLCLLFDIRDEQIDKLENISTLAVILGAKRSYILCYFLLLFFVLLSVIQFIYLPDVPQLAAMVVSSAATFAIIEFSKKNNSDVIYLAGVDGMMLLQAVLVIFASLMSGSH